MSPSASLYQRILVATDFSPHANAALRQGVWIARLTGAHLVLAHALPDLKRAVHSSSYEARLDLLYGEGDLFQREIRRESDETLRRSIAHLEAADLHIKYETLLGEPFVEIIHTVQQEGYDLVLAGSRGMAGWEQFIVGSTAKRLVRKCPASVWITKAEHAGPPRVVLAATDFSEVSLKAVRHGRWIAQRADAEFHLLHVLDSADVPSHLFSKVPEERSLREEVRAEAQRRLESLVESMSPQEGCIRTHLAVGTPWQEIERTAQHLHADLIALGTVGRSGVKGLLLGNTAEKVLAACDCSILTVKPDDFVSPIHAASWPLHPGPQAKPSGSDDRHA